MNLISDHKMRERVHKGAKEKEAEEEIISHEKINDVLYNKNSCKPNDSPTYFYDSLRWGLKGPKESKEIRKLINECDNLINGLDSDLVLARSGLMGSKRQKVSNYNKEVRELIRECDEFITSIESDLAQARRKLKRTKCNHSSALQTC